MSSGIKDFNDLDDLTAFYQFIKKYNYRVIETSDSNNSTNDFWMFDFGDTLFGYRSSSATRVMEASAPKDSISVLIPSGSTLPIANGCRLQNNTIYVSSHDELRLVAPKNYSHYFINVPQSRLRKYLGNELTLAISMKLKQLTVHHVNYLLEQNITDEINHLGYRLKALHQSSHEVVPSAVHIESFLVELIGRYLVRMPDLTLNERSRSQPTRIRLVDRALEIMTNSGAQMTIFDIAQKSHCSVRTLEYAFNEILGVSPKHFMKLNRLNALYQKLLFCEDKRQIKGLLSDFGVSNASRFGNEYRLYFGEAPLDTLGKAHKLHLVK